MTTIPKSPTTSPSLESQGTQPSPRSPQPPDSAPTGWSRLTKNVGVGLLLILLLVETILLIFQWQASHSISQAQEKAMAAFLNAQRSMEGGKGPTSIALKNVRFCWSPKICVLTEALSAEAIPVHQNRPVNFDDPLSFNIAVEQSSVLIEPSVLEGMFNESVFNYPGSKLRNLTIAIARNSGQRVVRLNGQIDLIFWLPFQMDTMLSVDRQTNTLVIQVQHLNLLGFIPVTPFIEFKPFNLDKILNVPENEHLAIHQNKIFVKPFGLFPPPRIQGTMKQIIVKDDRLELDFSGNRYDGPASIGAQKNFILIKGGATKFSNLQMSPTHLLLLDQQTSSPLIFSLPDYSKLLPQGKINLQPDHSIEATFPDYQWKTQ